MGYHDLEDGARPAGPPGRKAIAIAGAATLAPRAPPGWSTRSGFDPSSRAALRRGRAAFEPGTELFGANVGREDLVRHARPVPDSDRGRRRRRRPCDAARAVEPSLRLTPFLPRPAGSTVIP